MRHQVSATRDYCNTRNLKIVKEFEFDDAILIKKPTLKKIVKFIESSCKNSDSKVVLVSHSIDTFKGYFEEFTLLKGFVKQGLLEIHFIREKLALDYIYILKCDTFSDISMIIQNARSYYNSNFLHRNMALFFILIFHSIYLTLSTFKSQQSYLEPCLTSVRPS